MISLETVEIVVVFEVTDGEWPRLCSVGFVGQHFFCAYGCQHFAYHFQSDNVFKHL